jgi:hypothetical protein
MRRLVEGFLDQHGFDLRLSFPSDMAKPLFQRYGAGPLVERLPLWMLRGQVRRPLPALVRPLARAALASGRFVAEHPRSTLDVVPLARLGPEIDELAEASSSFARCIRIRDSAYLRWRWLEQPEAEWSLRAALAPDGRVQGLSVLGLDSGASGLTGSIADLLARDARALRALLVDASRTVFAAGARSVSLYYLDPRPWARRVLLRSGFLPTGDGHDFIARGFTPAAGDVPERAGSWYMTRGDTEPWPNSGAP